MGLDFPTKEQFLSQKVFCKLGEGSCLSGLKTPDRAYLGMLAEMDLREHKKDRMVGMGRRGHHLEGTGQERGAVAEGFSL